MISRIVMAMALVAGTVAIHATAQAQTGVTAQSAVNSGAASPNGSVGTTSNTPRNNSSSSSTTMGPTGGGTTNSSGMSSSSSASSSAQPGMNSQTGMATQGTMSAQGSTPTQGHMPARKGVQRGRGGDMAERQMTECLNSAASQGTSMDSCKR